MFLLCLTVSISANTPAGEINTLILELKEQQCSI